MNHCDICYLLYTFVLFSSVIALKPNFTGLYNIAIVANHEMTLTCLRPSNPKTSVNWYYSMPMSLDIINISRGSHVLDISGKFVLTGDIPGQHLYIKSVQMREAGAYMCEAVIANQSGGAEIIADAKAEVIVLASHPTFTVDRIVRVQNKTKLNCSIQWSGNWKPTITWTLGEVSYHFDASIDDLAFDNISRLLDSSVAIVDGLITTNKSLTCRTHFSNTTANSSRPTATGNVPDYSYSYTWTENTTHDKPLCLPGSPIADTGILLYAAIGGGAAGLVIITIIFICVMRKYWKGKDKAKVEVGCDGQEGETTDGPPVFAETTDITKRTLAGEPSYVDMSQMRSLMKPAVRSKASGYENVDVIKIVGHLPETLETGVPTISSIDEAEIEPCRYVSMTPQ